MNADDLRRVAAKLGVSKDVARLSLDTTAEAHNAPDTAPVVLWQTGGPGCSSLLAAFTENGPCLVPETGPNAGKAVVNPYAWNTNATMIW